ncbi:MAG: hypothetical protein H6822_15875 [Planctomycetaceae bacterium]|nr:hypothetical protein [Planctomycetales bacterium]MCB9923659.1 hypothetical protein [Planctomycetaceae bacterium]
MVANSTHVRQIVELMRAATACNLTTPSCVGCVIQLGSLNAKEVLVAADLHGNRLNFEKLLAKADLLSNPGRHLVMQEVCHGGPTYPGGGCMSHLLLEDVAKLKVAFPERFHFILSNHELAELTDFAIMKSGKMLNLSFREGMQRLYGDQSEEVRAAYLEFLASCPVAVRLESGIVICHSAPENVDREGYATQVFGRRLEPRDFKPRSPVFCLVWGRDFREENAVAFADLVQADLLIHGHEPCELGFQVPNSRQIILDCCSEDACFVVVPASGKITQQEVVDRIIKLHSPATNDPNE